MRSLRRRLVTTRPYYGWIVVVLCLLALLSTFSINFSFGVFFEYVLEDLSVTRTAASVVFSVQNVSLYVTAAVVGGVVDRVGARRLLWIGAGLLGLGMLGASQATSLRFLLVSYGVVAGVGMGIVYIIGFTLPFRWFQRRRGRASAIATSGVGLSTLLAPPLAAALIARVGWQDAYLVMTAASLAGIAVVASLVDTDPWSLGLDPAAEFPDGRPEQVDGTGLRAQLASTAAIVRSRSFLLVVFAWIVLFSPVYTLLMHLVSITLDAGFDRWVGVLALSLVGGLSVPGRFLFGTVADWGGRAATVVGLVFAIAVSLLVVMVAAQPAVLLAAAGCFGLLYGGVAALLTPLVVDFYGSARVSTLYGISTISFALAALAGPALAAMTFEETGGYAPFLAVSALFVLGGGIGVALAARDEGAW